jgi:lysophospholipase L1-like esterase
MRKRLIYFAVVCVSFALMSFMQQPKPIRVYMIGDSTMSLYDKHQFPINGWGMPFANYFDNGIVIVNKAKPGRSTRTFLAENRWKPVADSLQTGDYVLMQFGHNDEGDSIKYKDRFTPVPDFKRNLIKFITETKAKNANPILITPVSRRNFDKDGKAKETHIAYTKAVFEIGDEYKVPIIDLDKKSRELIQQLGPERSKLLFMQLDSAEHPNYPVGRLDNTHFNDYGARKIAELVLNELKTQNSPLAAHIVIGTNKSNVAPAAK